MLSLHLIASEIKRLYISVLIMIMNRMGICLNKERKLCLTFGLRSIIQFLFEHHSENGKEKEIRLVKDSDNENNYLLLTYYLDDLCICSLYSSLHTLRHKAFSAICEKRRIFTLLMNTNGSVFCCYRTTRGWREFPTDDWQFKNCRLRFAFRIDLTVTKMWNNSV